MNHSDKFKRSCYATRLGNCAGGVSGEHYVSESFLREIGGTEFRVTGLSQFKGKEQTLPLTTIKSKVLCRQHNSLLSELDAFSLDFLKAIRAATRHLYLGEPLLVPRLRFEGRMLERWMLKCYCGLVASGATVLPRNQLSDTHLRALFDASRWPEHWILTCLPNALDWDEIRKVDVQFTCTSESNWFRCNINGFEVMLTLASSPDETMDVLWDYYHSLPAARPPEMVMKRGGKEVTLELVWP